LFDKNGDGVIDREEFTELVNSKPDILLAAIHSMIDVFIQSKRSKAVTHRQDPTSAKIVPMNT
jgi:Ca2+-binding EF-hand superfamily protein